MNRLDHFLNVAARQMRIMPDAGREDELRELRGHLQQRIEDYRGQGMSDDAAQLRALEGLGSPRKLGASLCDAWEGIAFGWWRLIAVVVGVTAFLGFGMLALTLAFSILPTNSEIALLPEVVPILCGLYIALPLFCGLIFTHWLGRRGRLGATLYFLALAMMNFTVTFPASNVFGAPPANFVAIANATWFRYFWVILAFIGAYTEHVWRLQTRYKLAIVGEHVSSSRRALWTPFNLKLWRNALLMTILGGAIYSGRVWREFHPQTPTATLKKVLLTAGPQGFDAPEILELRELPPASAAERRGSEQRIHFRMAARAKPYFAANQIKYLQGRINSQKKRKHGDISSDVATLERVKNNRQLIEGTVTMVKTKNGCRADEKSFDFIVLWKWFYYDATL